jgi:hypothetical protein
MDFKPSNFHYFSDLSWYILYILNTHLKILGPPMARLPRWLGYVVGQAPPPSAVRHGWPSSLASPRRLAMAEGIAWPTPILTSPPPPPHHSRGPATPPP